MGTRASGHDNNIETTGVTEPDKPSVLEAAATQVKEQVKELGHEAAEVLEEVGETAEEVAQHFEWLGRVGWVAKGIVYALIGVLFLNIAVVDSGSGEANQAGALEAIAQKPGGTPLIITLGVGLALYAVWRVLTVVLPGDWTGRALLDRLGYAVSAAVYISLLVTILEIVRSVNNTTDSSEDRLIEGIVKDVLSMTAGRTLVIAAGIVVCAIGIVFMHKGWTRSFRSDISGDDGVEETAIDRLGTVGWIARGVSMFIIGAFLARAAWMFDPDEAAGLDDSMRQLAGSPVGGVLAAMVGIGFIAYGVFAILSARHRELKGPRNED